MSKKALVTGGAGFIGACLVQSWLKSDRSIRITNFDKLTYSGDLSRLSAIRKDPRHTFVRGDVCDAKAVRRAMSGVDVVIHAAAETHVDRSLLDGRVFLETNVYGTQVLLEEARRAGVERFILVSTDEVYGSRPSGYFKETDRLNPSSPYSVSKAAADLLALSYHSTHGLPVSVTRGANTYGPFQYPEKVIPLFVSNALSGESLPVYGDGKQVRNWIHAEDHARAILHALKKGKAGEVYNISSKTEMTNMALTRRLLRILGLGEDLIKHVKDRPGHDRRYGIDSSKLRRLGWQEQRGFDEAFTECVLWYRDHASWWKKIKAKKEEFANYYRRAYAGRM